MPVVVFSVIFATFGGCWWLSELHERSEIQLQTSITAEQVAIRLQDYLAARFAAVETLQQAWRHGHITDRAEYAEHVHEILGTFSGFQAINWTDADGYIRWLAPEVGNAPAQDALLRNHPVAGPVLDEVDRTGRPAATPPTRLIQGGRGFAAYFPLSVHERAAGYVNAVFRLQPLITDCFGSDVAANFQYVVSDGPALVYATRMTDDEGTGRFQATCPVRVLNRTWNLTLMPRAHMLAAHEDPAGTGILIMGFLLAFALAWEWRRLSHSRRSLRIRTAELQAVYQAYPDMQFRLASDGTILDCQSGVQSRLCAPPERLIGRRMQEVLPADVGDDFRYALSHLAVSNEPQRIEYAVPFDDGAEHFEARILPMRRDERIVIIREITEQKRAEQRQKLMMDELDHRVKNSLASILALHEQTLASAVSLHDYRDRFTGRLVALARIHETLAGGKWAGINIRRFLNDTLLGEAVGGGDRIRLRGDDFMLPANIASVLCLALHELMTNAIKHGSLSVPEGAVDLSWRRDPGADAIHLTWREHDGPSVSPPGETGIGISIIDGLIDFQLGGNVALDFRPAGLVAEIDLPLGRAAADARRPKPRAAAATVAAGAR